MNMIVNHAACLFDDISERDMDMLFLEEFVSSPDFLKIFTDQIGIDSSSVVSVQSSKMDIELVESDMTVIVNSGGKRIGLISIIKVISVILI